MRITQGLGYVCDDQRLELLSGKWLGYAWVGDHTQARIGSKDIFGNDVIHNGTRGNNKVIHGGGMW